MGKGLVKSSLVGARVSSAAAKVLKDKAASKAEKAVAASALTQTKSAKEKASKQVAAAATRILRDPKASIAARSVAASALTQKPSFRAKNVRTDAIYRAVKTYLARSKA